MTLVSAASSSDELGGIAGFAVSLMERIWPAFQDIDTSSGALGTAVARTLEQLIPILADWWARPTALVARPLGDLSWLEWALLVMALGVFLSGARDLYAALGLPGGNWPWPRPPAIQPGTRG